MATCKIQKDPRELVAFLDRLSEDELEEQCKADPKSIITELLKELKTTYATVGALESQLAAKDHVITEMKNEENAYRVEIDKLKRDQGEALAYIDRLQSVIQRMGTHVGELRSELEELRNDWRAQISLRLK